MHPLKKKTTVVKRQIGTLRKILDLRVETNPVFTQNFDFLDEQERLWSSRYTEVLYPPHQYPPHQYPPHQYSATNISILSPSILAILRVMQGRVGQHGLCTAKLR